MFDRFGKMRSLEQLNEKAALLKQEGDLEGGGNTGQGERLVHGRRRVVHGGKKVAANISW